MGAVIQWLFTDPVTAGNGLGKGPNGSEQFHFYLPWIIFCVLGLLVWTYYWAEGRKRFFKKNILNKRLMDKYTNKFAAIALVGLPLIACRYLLDTTFFAWRFWRYLWLLWLAYVVIRLAIYLSPLKLPRQKKQYWEDRAAYRRNERLLQYFPKPREAKKARS
jgi:hypothetical protein